VPQRQRLINPHQAYQSALPGLENIFAGFNHIFVVEMNDEGIYGYGQLGGLLRALL
jgi:2-oxoglutarate ferredoxin oxidoreductase subunit alpha